MGRFNNMFTEKQVEVQGTVEKGFEAVKERFENNFRNGDELSAQVCVYHKGKRVKCLITHLWRLKYVDEGCRPLGLQCGPLLQR